MEDLFSQLDEEDRGSFATVKYELPTMGEIDARPKNGLQAVGSFSGCGGSSLGLKMAGWTMRAAIEFIPEAAATYRANFPSTKVYERDIRTVTPGEILADLGIAEGELDLFEGSPPCSSFSTAGRGDQYRAHTCPECGGKGRVAVEIVLDAADAAEEPDDDGFITCANCEGKGRLEGVAKKYSDSAQTTDDLFDHWVRILAGLRPRGFLAENVPGMLAGSALADYANVVVAQLSGLGYHVQATVLDAAHYGVPQRRKRLIFAGVRRDVADAMPWPPQETTSARPFTTAEALAVVPADDPDHGPMLAGSSMEGKAVGRSWHMMQAGIRKDFVEMERIAKTCAKCGEVLEDHKVVMEVAQSFRRTRTKETREKPVLYCADGEKAVEVKRYFLLTIPRLDKPCGTITATAAQSGSASVSHPTECRKFTPAEAKALSGFPLDFKLTGSREQRAERIGRTVMPPMYEVIGRHLAEVLAR